MTDTIPNVPRNLLERVLNAGWGSETVNALDDLRDFLESAPSSANHVEDVRAMVAAPSPAGVDGMGNTAKLLLPALRQYMHNDGSGLLAGYDLETTQAIIDGLRGEVGAQRIKTCTALKERNDAREERDSFQRIGIRQIEHRYQLAALLLEKFPRIDPHHPITLSEVDHCCEYVLHKDRERLHCAIDAALSAGKEGE